MENFLKPFLFDPIVGKLVGVAAGMLLIVVIVRFLQRSLTRYIKDADTRYRAKKFISVFGYLAGILLLMVVFSDRLGRLTVAFGVAGAGIAFALQEVIASIAGWVAISFGRFYRTGDRIQLGGIKGDVIDIGLLRTTMMECGQWVQGDLYNGRIVRVANSFVFKEPVFNYSADFPFLWDEIVVPVKYGSDYKLAKSILRTIADELVGEYTKSSKAAWKDVVERYMIYEAEVDPVATLSADQNWIEFTVRYIVDYKKRRATKNQFFTRILEEFDKTDGQVVIATTSAEINLVNSPAFDSSIVDQTKA